MAHKERQNFAGAERDDASSRREEKSRAIGRRTTGSHGDITPPSVHVTCWRIGEGPWEFCLDCCTWRFAGAQR
jgi:hypothetical protein